MCIHLYRRSTPERLSTRAIPISIVVTVGASPCMSMHAITQCCRLCVHGPTPWTMSTRCSELSWQLSIDLALRFPFLTTFSINVVGKTLSLPDTPKTGLPFRCLWMLMKLRSYSWRFFSTWFFPWQRVRQTNGATLAARPRLRAATSFPKTSDLLLLERRHAEQRFSRIRWRNWPNETRW